MLKLQGNQYLNKCKISSTVLCSLFDHKNIFLSFGAHVKTENKLSLSNRFLDSPILKAAVTISAYRCNLLALVADNPVLTGRLEEEKNKAKTCWESIKRYFDLEFAAAGNPTNLNINLAAAEMANVNLLISELLGSEQLEVFEKRCTSIEYFTALTDEVKKTGAWAQKKIFRITREKVKFHEKKLEDLKRNFDINFDEIFKIEKKLAKIRDEELRDKLMDLKIFECLNAERSSPHFLDIAKKSKKESSIENIKDDDGNDFVDETAREAHIVGFYEKLYEQDLRVHGSIEDFLGPDIIQRPQIRASKLTEDERDRLDSPLLIEELDKALKQVNIKSAPGVDGYSYRFIKKFWSIFRTPLFNCATESLETGNLPESFLTAQIKIIPKKGDCSKIKNWRPISLLSNFYKLISRMINNRLKKITNRVMSRGQKGFNQSRQLHEVLINALENMNFCKKNKIKGALLSIDMAKAFDSVAHSFLEKVYEFFGFGVRIRSWLKAIGTGRNAVVILENGKVSSKFNLRRGTAQGDSPSPFLYNLAAQILIWKIELDPEIKGIHPQLVQNPDPAAIDREFWAYESNFETNKNESFADDANNFLLLEYSTLFKLKTVLAEFKVLSGLECNVDKSYVMRIGNLDGEIDQRILDLGFPFTNELTVLGFVLQNNGDMVARNFEKVREKILNIIRFWERFNLSLPGKIMIYKTLLLPQINFISTILTPHKEILDELSDAMTNFVTKGFYVSKKKLFVCPSKGGLGLFDLSTFIQALQCTWVKRALVCNDNWKVTLKGGAGNILECDSLDQDTLGIGLRNIVKSYKIFKDKFFEFKNNFLLDKIFCNDRYGTGRAMAAHFDENFFGNLLNSNPVQVRNVTWGSISHNLIFVRYADFEHFAGFHVSLPMYQRLKQCFENLKKRFKGGDCEPCSIETFFRRIKKGSRHFRAILCHMPINERYYSSLPQIKKFLEITDTNFSGDEFWKRSINSWNTYCFPNRLRTFLYKYYANILGTGNRVFHFNRNIDPTCTFCSKAKNFPSPLESFPHVFYDCPIVNPILEMFFTKYLNVEVSRQFFFSGGGVQNGLVPKEVYLIFDLLRYTIWQCKLQKHSPSFFTVEFETLRLLDTICGISNKIKYSIINSQFIDIDGGRQPRDRPHP